MPDRDMEIYHEYYRARAEHTPPRLDDATRFTKIVSGPVSAKSTESLEWDVQTLKDAATGKDLDDLFVCFISPGWVRNLSWNEHYATLEEEYFAIAAALRPFYKAIVDAGVVLQIDAPDLVDTWTLDRWDDVAGYRKDLEMRVEALNTALEGLPEEQVRLHFCWGSWHGPHSGALPLEHVLDIIYRVPAQCYSIEAAKPNHAHEWRVFEKHKLPDGKILMPGVIDHTTSVIEHPQVIADRIVTYAKLVGRENVIGGTDCGMRIDSRVEWAKLQAMVDGAKLATDELFG
jgi:5-methyltetrahydropteroyltriglutamate--homocysteine methyltransferase